MSVADIRIKAERYAYAQVEELRMNVLGALGDSPSLSGWQGKNLRDRVQSAVTASMNQAKQSGGSFLRDAWNTGIDRATGEFASQVPNLPASSVADGVPDGIEVISTAIDSTTAALTKSLRTILLRASTGGLDMDDVLDQLRDKSSSGLFDRAKRELAGTLSEEVTMMESQAHAARADEINKFIALHVRSGLLSKVKGKSPTAPKLVPVTLTIWRHKPIGTQMHPRPNHLDMDWKAVVFDSSIPSIPFTLEGADGVTYHPLAPKLPPLPIGETANCGCTVIHRVIWATPEKKQKLIERSKETGGFPYNNGKL